MNEYEYPGCIFVKKNYLPTFILNEKHLFQDDSPKSSLRTWAVKNKFALFCCFNWSRAIPQRAEKTLIGLHMRKEAKRKMASRREQLLAYLLER